MKMTMREKIMLAVMAVVIISVGYYYLLFEPQLQEISRLTIEHDELRMLTESAGTYGISIKSYRKRYEELLKNAENETVRFFPDIIQEKIIVMLNQLIEKSNITSSSENFAEIEIDPVVTTKKPVPKTYPLEDLTNEYRESVESISDSDELQNDNGSENDEENKPENTQQSVLSSLESLSVSLQLTGTFDQLMSFIKSIEDLDRTIIIRNMSSSKDEEGVISTGMKIEFYALPKIHMQDEEYYKWPFANKYGKESPFEMFPGYQSQSVGTENDGTN